MKAHSYSPGVGVYSREIRVLVEGHDTRVKVFEDVVEIEFRRFLIERNIRPRHAAAEPGLRILGEKLELARSCRFGEQIACECVRSFIRRVMRVVAAQPVIVGEFRGGKGETAKRFDKSDKNAAPIEFGMYKFNLELLGDGAPVMISVFLDAGIKAEEFAPKVQIKRGDIVVGGVNKLELKNGVRRASCGMTNFVALEKAEIEQLRRRKNRA